MKYTQPTGLLILAVILIATSGCGSSTATDSSSSLLPDIQIRQPVNNSSITAGEVFSIAVVADPQYADTAPRGPRSPREGLPRLQYALTQWNQRDLDWGVILGDHVDWDDVDYADVGYSPALPALPAPLLPKPAADHDWNHTRAILNVFQQLNAPTYPVLGNHEFYVPDKNTDGLSKPYSVYRQYGLDQKAYYSFRHKGFRFVVIEIDWRYHNHDARAALNSDYSPPRTDYEVSKAYFEDFSAWEPYWWNGAISIKQRLWLMELLDESNALGEKVVLMAHDPLAPAANPGHDIFNKFEMLAILNNYPNVVMWLDGHDHNGGYELQNSRHHLNLCGMQNTNNADCWYQMDFSPDFISLYRAENTVTPERVMDIRRPRPTLTAPTAFSVTGSAGDAVLVWDIEPTGTTSVVIERRHVTLLRAEVPSTAKTLAWKIIHTDTALVSQSYKDTSAPNPLAQYKYRIRFLDGSEGSRYSSALGTD